MDIFFNIAALGRPKELKDFLALALNRELINCVNDLGENALIQCVHGAHFAADAQALQRYVTCAEMLIEAGVDVNGADADARTAVHWAVQLNRRPLLEVLLNKGAVVDVEDRLGFKPFHLAVQCNAIDCISALATTANKQVRLVIHNVCNMRTRQTNFVG